MSGTNDAAQAGLSDQHKEAVKSWVPKVRKVLEKDLMAQLTRLGVRDGGKGTPLEEMTLTPDAPPRRWLRGSTTPTTNSSAI